MRKLSKKYGLTGRLARLVNDAEKDTDRVSMLTLQASPWQPCEASIVVIKGHGEIEMFRQWAERNKLLTPGKGVIAATHEVE